MYQYEPYEIVEDVIQASTDEVVTYETTINLYDVVEFSRYKLFNEYFDEKTTRTLIVMKSGINHVCRIAYSEFRKEFKNFLTYQHKAVSASFIGAIRN